MTAPATFLMQTIRLIFIWWQRFFASQPARICLIIAVLTACRYWVSYDPAVRVPEHPESFALARSIAYKGQFANPFAAMETGPSAHLAPLFPAFLALLIRVFGAGGVGFYAYQMSAIIAVCVLVAMLPLASKCLGAGFATGVMAAFAWLAAKPFLYANWECTYAAVFVLIATCLVRKIFDASPRSAGLLKILLGVTAGLLACLLPTALPAILVWFLWLAWTKGIRTFHKHYWPLLLLPALVISPWIARNYLVFHRIIPVRDNLGLELSVSNNDCAAYSLDLNLKTGCFAQHHPNKSADEAKRVITEGEPEYNNIKLHQAVRWISTHKGQFFRLSLQRAFIFWLPNESGSPFRDAVEPGLRMLRLIEYAMTFFSIIGLHMLLRRDRISGVLCSLWLGLFPMTYYFIQFDERYRLPILWMTFLIGALPLTAAARKLARKMHLQRALEGEIVVLAGAGHAAHPSQVLP